MKYEVRFAANAHFDYSDWLLWGSEKANDYVDQYSTGPGCELQLWISVTPSQIKHHDYFFLEPRHILRGSDAADKKNTRYAEALPIHHQTPFGRFKVRDTVYVKDIKPYDNRVWSLEFGEAYVATSELIDSMVSQFSGIQRGQVKHHRTEKPVEHWHSFYSDHWLNQLHTDEAAHEKAVEDERYIDTKGLYVGYLDELDEMPDMFRLPQVYNDLGDSHCVVHRKVIDFWHAQGIKKSFSLRPFLVYGTSQYHTYIAMFQRISKALYVNPNNRIR